MDRKTKFIIAIILITLGVATRLLPHLWNFAPIAAITLFAGFYLGRRYALALPLVTMLIGDFFIGFYDWKLMLVVYGSYLIVGLAATIIKRYKSAEIILASSFFSSMLFFLATNWAVWQFSPWYERSLSGLIYCYALALPFFRNTLLGDLFYVLVLFGAYEFVLTIQSKRLFFIQTNKSYER